MIREDGDGGLLTRLSVCWRYEGEVRGSELPSIVRETHTELDGPWVIFFSFFFLFQRGPYEFKSSGSKIGVVFCDLNKYSTHIKFIIKN